MCDNNVQVLSSVVAQLEHPTAVHLLQILHQAQSPAESAFGKQVQQLHSALLECQSMVQLLSPLVPLIKSLRACDDFKVSVGGFLYLLIIAYNISIAILGLH